MSHSSRRWLDRHLADPYVRRSRAEGWRSRAAYKLIDLDRLERLLAPGARVIDLGAAPGGWSQVAASRAGSRGTVVAVDLLPMPALPGVRFIQGDFLDPSIRQSIPEALGGPADVLLSDMMPNVSGIASRDQARAAELAHAAIGLGQSALGPEGVLVLKVFQGSEFPGLLRALRRGFESVRTRKPAASRDESRETYLVARRPKAPQAAG
jgi:23S rRNA (uridine2552-2'-O)-methyltransferase